MKPKRIQRKRTKGWKMPPNTVYVGRPSIWGNPYRVTDYAVRQFAVDDFRNLVLNYSYTYPPLSQIREQLRGKDLACWCPLDQPCHADVLLEIANAPEVTP